MQFKACGSLFFFRQLCPINHFLKALNKETLSSCSLALHNDGELVAGRPPRPHPYPCVVPGSGSRGHPAPALVVFVAGGGTALPPWSRKQVPRDTSSMGWTADGTGDKADSDDDARLWSRDLAAVVAVPALRLARHMPLGSSLVPTPHQGAGTAPWPRPALPAACSGCAGCPR